MMTTETVNVQDEKKSAFLGSLSSAFQGAETYAALRKSAWATLNKFAIPGTKTEAWKYTRVGKVINPSWMKSHGNSQINLPEIAIGGLRYVFVDGLFRADLSDELTYPGLNIRRTGENAENNLLGTLSNHQGDWFEALNAAFFNDGLVIEVDKNAQIDRPVHLVFFTSEENTASFSRNVLSLQESSSLHVFTHYIGSEHSTFSSVVTEAFVGKNAALKIDKIQEGNETAFHHVDWTKQDRDSRFDITTVTLKSSWVRNDLNIRVAGENCHSSLTGAYLPSGKEHVDNHTMVDHMVPNCESDEKYKGIVRENATAVFNGKVFVRPDAQKTNAFQQNANIVLDDTATMFSKPELEIYADDVKCSHGSTTGQFDEEAVFYLRARGIGEVMARKLLVEAFLADVITTLSDERLQTYCTEKIQQLMHS
jgi:Fe-S cluster assembly protein SufD